MLIKQTILFIAVTILFSCGSDELSKRKAESLINDCESNSYTTRKMSFYSGDRSLKFKQDQIPKYEKLQADGLITFEKKGSRYSIALTEKGKTFIVDYKEGGKFSQKLSFGNPKNKLYVKSATYKLDKINEIQEMPQMNLARVNTTFTLVETTPFSILLLDKNKPKEYYTRDLEFRKTTDGWKFCKD